MAGLLSSGAFYDPAAVAAAQAAATPQSDGRTILGDADWLKLLNPVNGLTKQYNAATANGMSSADYAALRQTLISQGGDVSFMPATQTPDTYKDAQGRNYNVVGTDANGNPLIRYADIDGGGFRNPTGSDKDHVQATYSLDAQGNAVPVSAQTSYDPSQWVSSGRDAAKILGTVLSAGAAGAALGGGAAAAGGAAGGGAGAAADVGYMGAGSLGAGSAADAATTLGAGGAAAGGGGAAAGGAAAGGGGAAAGGGTAANAAGVAGSSLIPGISNGQLLTTGAGLLGGALGSNSSLNSATNSSQNKIDPRIAQYLYGAQGNGGLLNSVNNLTNAQLATGGLNANQSQGLQMQLDALKDPGYTQGLAQMRSAGQGLLGSGVAANPFTSGAAGAFAPQAGQGIPAIPAGIPANTGNAGWQPMQTQLNAPRPGMSSGLLGNNRPYGS